LRVDVWSHRRAHHYTSNHRCRRSTGQCGSPFGGLSDYQSFRVPTVNDILVEWLARIESSPAEFRRSGHPVGAILRRKPVAQRGRSLYGKFVLGNGATILLGDGTWTGKRRVDRAGPVLLKAANIELPARWSRYSNRQRKCGTEYYKKRAASPVFSLSMSLPPIVNGVILHRLAFVTRLSCRAFPVIHWRFYDFPEQQPANHGRNASVFLHY